MDLGPHATFIVAAYAASAFILALLIGWIVTASFVRWYEEPTLVRTYGEQYEQYRRHVPAWTPRLTPWHPSRQNGGGS